MHTRRWPLICMVGLIFRTLDTVSGEKAHTLALLVLELRVLSEQMFLLTLTVSLREKDQKETCGTSCLELAQRDIECCDYLQQCPQCQYCLKYFDFQIRCVLFAFRLSFYPRRIFSKYPMRELVKGRIMGSWLLKKLNSLGKLNLFMYNFSNSKQWQDNSFRGISPHHHMTWVWKCELTCVFLMWINSLTPVLYSLSYHLYVSPHELVSHPSSWLFLSLLHVFWHEFSLSWKSVIACHHRYTNDIYLMRVLRRVEEWPVPVTSSQPCS